MASCSIETVPDARLDLISELPADLKERILECLPTRDAARTPLLSTHWKDAWLRLGRLAFDWDFFRGIQKCKGDSVLHFVKIITYILLQRVRPVKKFSLLINSLSFFDPMLEQSDLDKWFLFLSRNGIEELYISLLDGQYKLPFCIVSCPTIKQLRLYGLGFDGSINAPNLMASCSIETIADARRDLISELPANVKERILQRLPTRDAARTALLSTH